REITGIKNLKISFNKVFGYYIEVTNSFKDNVPMRYIRKQTLTNGERYFTPELKEIEEKILGSEEKALKLEATIYQSVKSELENNLNSLRIIADSLATLDVLISFSEVSKNSNYVRPEINKRVDSIEIYQGRHPVIEKMLKNAQFVPNDTYLDDENSTMIITGPNMAGKSTYMRQVALITLMAHVGCYVPAKSAKISITDRIFTRVGASDDLGLGQSTFMVEMVEVASIIQNATKKSLLILDEIGRGTATWDGMSIAWAVIEYICNVIKCKTLFATHYHELTKLEGILGNAHNYRVTVKELSDTVVFLHKIDRGGANKSFGIEVAKLAGVPKVITGRAKEILTNLEKNDFLSDANSIMLDGIGEKKGQQMNLFQSENTEVINIIKGLDINNCSPMQAFNILQNLKEKL
ncbi:MAG: DNA mismatch repair protein MutS, partial [Christensenellales bacterium]